MPVRKNHKQIKTEDFEQRKGKKDVPKCPEIEREIADNLINMNRYKAQPVEGYQPLYKRLNEQFPIEKRY